MDFLGKIHEKFNHGFEKLRAQYVNALRWCLEHRPIVFAGMGGLVLVGVFISIVLELSGISALAFAVGVYLPVSTSTPIMVGGLVRWLIDRRQKTKTSDAEADSGPGVLFSSGLIAGAAVLGTIHAMLQIPPSTRKFLEWITVTPFIGAFGTSDLVAILLFLALAVVLYLVASGRLLRSRPDGRSPAG